MLLVSQYGELYGMALSAYHALRQGTVPLFKQFEYTVGDDLINVHGDNLLFCLLFIAFLL